MLSMPMFHLMKSCMSPEDRVVEILKNKIDAVAVLPCDRIKSLLLAIEKSMETISLTREENGVGICAGMYLGGKRVAMVIQSSGIGNMINALESLNLTYNIPLPILASWRGVYKETIEAQKPLGSKLPKILDAAGISYTIILSKEEIYKVEHAIQDSFTKHRPHVVLISPLVWESSYVLSPLQICPRVTELRLVAEIAQPVMTRYEVIKVLCEIVNEDIIVSNLGIPSKELYEIRDRDLNFYMLGSMGLASSIGLGLALAQKRHVYVIDGDGSLLMNPNALTSIGTYNPENLSVIAVDNAAYGSTGNQPTCTLNQVDLELLAKVSGIKDTIKAHTREELRHALLEKVGFIHVITKPVNHRCKEIPLSAEEIKKRFMKATKSFQSSMVYSNTS